MATSPETQDLNHSAYELLPSHPEETTLPATQMGFEEMKESRAGDTVARHAALVAASTLVTVTWTITLTNNLSKMGWFALHPLLESLALFLFTFGIITLQPTNQPKTKAAGLTRHQILVFLLALPAVVFGTFAVSFNKWLRDANHFTTWHGTIGIICIIWLAFQMFLGAGSVWLGGALFGGGMKAKALWKYHRLSGYLLFLLLLLSAHMGGAWSSWGARYSVWIVRFIAYTLAPLVILAGVCTRIRTSKMKFY